MFTALLWLSGFLIGVTVSMIAVRMRSGRLSEMIQENKILNEKLKQRLEHAERELAKMTLSYAMRMRKAPKPKSANERTPVEDIEA